MSGRKIRSQITFTVLFIIFMMIAKPALCGASAMAGDIQGHWAQSIISDVMNSGIVSGYADGTFRPDAAINRAEYAALIVKAFGLSGGSDKVFKDTDGHWARDAVATAYQYGIVQGYSDVQFGPDDPVSREQAASMIVKAAGLNSTVSLDFSDQEAISPWAKSSVAAAIASGLFSGYPDGSFKPQSRTTRAEAAAVIYKYFNIREGKNGAGISKEFDKAGVYGPSEGLEVIAQNIVVKADGVVLQNLHIQGDLIIAEEVGEGNVTLNNITVDGDTMVRGGGPNSIHIDGGSFNNIIIQQTSSGAVRIVAVNTAGLEVVIAENAAGESIILEGNFANVQIEAANVELKTQGDTIIKNMTVSEQAGFGKISLDANSRIENLVLQAATEVKGAGRIVKAEVKANYVIFENVPEQQIVDSSVIIPPATTTTSSSGGEGDSDSGSHTKYYTLTIIKDGQGTVTPGEATYRKVQGSKIKLSAVPAVGWKFIGWFIYEDEYYTMASNNPEYEINGIGSNYTFRALFTVEYKGSGSIKDENNEPMEGVTLTLSGDYMETKTTSTDENGWWEALGLLGDVVVTPSLEGHVFEPMSRTIGWEIPVATFQGRPAEMYTLTINKQGQGTVVPEGTFQLEKGTRVPLTATPAEGWFFTGWVIGYDDQSYTQAAAAEYELELNRNTTMTANFAKESNVSYQLTITKQGEGTVTPGEGSYLLEEGTIVNLAAVPADGWIFIGWVITYPDNSFTQVAYADYQLELDKTQSWTAQFAESFTAQGTITASGTPLAGVAITLTKSGDSSEKVYASSDADGHWSAELREDSSYYIYMYKYKYTFPSVLIDSSSPNRNFTGTYTGNRIITYAMRDDTGGSGGGSVSWAPYSADPVADGTEITFTAQAAAGFQFVSWEIKKQNSDGSWEVLGPYNQPSQKIEVSFPVQATAYFRPI